MNKVGEPTSPSLSGEPRMKVVLAIGCFFKLHLIVGVEESIMMMTMNAQSTLQCLLRGEI
jgi:hypothetical protein